MTFSSGASFAGNLGSRVINQYIADRTGSGWETAGIDAPHGKTVFGGDDFNAFETEMNPFKLFTPDLTTSWFINTNAPPLTANAEQGVVNLYRSGEAGEYQALTTGVAENVGNLEVRYNPEIEGRSADFSDIVFAVRAKLTPGGASVTELKQLYDYANGELHLVSIRPDGTAATSDSNVGWNYDGIWEEGGMSVAHAVSDDGSRIYWSSATSSQDIYLRENPTQPQSSLSGGECTEPEKACTLLVGKGQRTSWGQAPMVRRRSTRKVKSTMERRLYTDTTARAKAPLRSPVKPTVSSA